MVDPPQPHKCNHLGQFVRKICGEVDGGRCEQSHVADTRKIQITMVSSHENEYII